MKKETFQEIEGALFVFVLICAFASFLAFCCLLSVGWLPCSI